MRALMHHTHDTPYCLIAKVCWGALRVLLVPEANASMLRAFGWSVLIRDSDMPQREGAWTWKDLASGPLLRDHDAEEEHE